eukprot:scaffold329692_cov20-Prasinocladus_malaysianus.AAC.1
MEIACYGVANLWNGALYLRPMCALEQWPGHQDASQCPNQSSNMQLGRATICAGSAVPMIGYGHIPCSHYTLQHGKTTGSGQRYICHQLYHGIPRAISIPVVMCQQ